MRTCETTVCLYILTAGSQSCGAFARIRLARAATLPPFASPSRPSSPPRTRRARRPSRKEKPETPRRRTHARRRTATGPRCALAHRYTRGRPHQHGRPWNVASQGLLCLHGQRQEAVRRGSAGAAPLHARGVCHPALPSPQQPPAVSMRGGHRGLASPQASKKRDAPRRPHRRPPTHTTPLRCLNPLLCAQEAMLPPRSRVARLTAAKGPPGKGGGGARVSGGIATHDQKG
jgi:hypothetical protein